MHWSTGAEKLTGFSRLNMTGKLCLTECVITEGDESELLITLAKTDGSRIRLKKWVQVLQDKAGAFAGGLGRLLPVSESSVIEVSRNTQLDSDRQSFQGLISRSPAMQAVFQIIENAAETTATVLVRGESGSGKELVAKAIHDL